MGKLIDLTGKQFGKLTVIERAEDHIFPNGKRGVTWKCLCSCKADLPENEKKYTYVLGENLKKGYTEMLDKVLSNDSFKDVLTESVKAEIESAFNEVA